MHFCFFIFVFFCVYFMCIGCHFGVLIDDDDDDDYLRNEAIFSAIVLFRHQRNPFRLAAHCYSWNCFPTFLLIKAQR